MIPFSEKYYRLSLLIFGWLGCFFIPNTILAQVPDQPTNYITDVANLFSKEEETLLNSTLKSFEDSTTNQIFVLLTQSLQGRNIDELTIETATRWGVGQKGKDNSLLIAFYVLDHQIRFEVGYGLEANLTDYETQRIYQDYMIPFLNNGDYFGAIHAGIIHAMGEISSAPQAERTEHISENYYHFNPSWLLISNRQGTWNIHISLIIAIGIAGIFLFHYLLGIAVWALGDKIKSQWFRWGIIWGGHGLYILLVFLLISKKTVLYVYPVVGDINLEILFLIWGFFWMNTLSGWVEISNEVYKDSIKQSEQKQSNQPAVRRKIKYQDYGFWIKVYVYIVNLLRSAIAWIQLIFLSVIQTRGLENISYFFTLLFVDCMIIVFLYLSYGLLTGKTDPESGSTSSTDSSLNFDYSSSSSSSSFDGGGDGSFGGGGSSSSW